MNNLPPGCSVSDIPGNRPEDQEWEGIISKFFDKDRLMDRDKSGFPISEEQYVLMDEICKDNKVDSMIDDYICQAIEYGMAIGAADEKLANELNRQWEGKDG